MEAVEARRRRNAQLALELVHSAPPDPAGGIAAEPAALEEAPDEMTAPLRAAGGGAAGGGMARGRLPPGSGTGRRPRAVAGDGAPSRPPPENRSPYVRDGRKIGRNEPCPCGSGKKYKQCHGRSKK